MASIRIAVVQSATQTDDPPKNVQRALAYIEQAAALGARVICLPETFPGPWTPPVDYDSLPELEAKARDLDVYLIAGMVEEIAGDADHHYNALVLLGPDGEKGRYRRTTPQGPWIYEGGSFWDFGYKAHDALPVFDIGECTIGLLICSEVYVPELARQLALKGAEDPLHAGRPLEEGAVGCVARANQGSRHREPRLHRNLSEHPRSRDQ